MSISIKFKSATDFRKSLEARLQGLAAETEVDLQRLRRKVAFDRFLARIFSREKPRVLSQGRLRNGIAPRPCPSYERHRPHLCATS